MTKEQLELADKYMYLLDKFCIDYNIDTYIVRSRIEDAYLKAIQASLYKDNKNSIKGFLSSYLFITYKNLKIDSDRSCKKAYPEDPKSKITIDDLKYIEHKGRLDENKQKQDEVVYMKQKIVEAAGDLIKDDKEYKILYYTAKGVTQKEISLILGISQRTVSRILDAATSQLAEAIKNFNFSEDDND